MLYFVVFDVFYDDGLVTLTDNAPILHDIALLKLDKPAVMSDYVNVICLDMDNGFPPGTPCIAAGWGQNMLGKVVITLHC